MLDNIISLYRDPLFGVVVLVAIILVLVIADYGRNKYRLKKRQIDLENFSKSYKESPLSDEITEFLALSKKPIPTLLFLADMYFKAGDSSSAIRVYLNLLQKTKDAYEKVIILESLGITYFKAGFLQRAKKIFLEVLKMRANNPEILLYLIRTYENMGEYKEALDTLECLDEATNAPNQNQSTRIYLQFMALSSDDFLSFDKKNEGIIKLMQDSRIINRLSLNYLCAYDRNSFWQELQRFNDVSFCIDILWKLQKDEIPLESIKSNSSIMDVYRAKGYIGDNVECEIFELEALRILHKDSKQKGDLYFEYRCHNCKNIFPFDSYRCSVCANVGEMDLIYKIKKDSKL